VVEVALRTILLADPAVSALVGDRIAPSMIPEDASLPALTYVVVDEEPDEHQEGLSGIETVSIQFSAWAVGTPAGSGYATSRKLARAVRRALHSKRQVVGDVSLEAITGGRVRTERPEVDTDVWHSFIEFEVIARVGQ